MADYNIVTNGNDDGSMICAAATEKLGFFAATPVVRQTAPTAVTAASTTTACNEAVAALQTALTNFGLIA